MSSIIDESSYISNSKLGNDCKMYRFCRVVNSEINDHVTIGDLSTVTDSVLGYYVHINRNSMIRNCNIDIYSYGGMNFTALHCKIGKYSSISWNVSIGGANHNYNNITTHAFLYNPNFDMITKDEELHDRFSEPCEVGNDVWIGAGAQILRGVKVGDGAVVAAGAIVTKDVPPYSIVAGIPGRVIKMRASEDEISRLLKIQWWNIDPQIIKSNINLFKSGINREILDKIEALSN